MRQEYKCTLKGMAKFELISFYGRHFLSSRKLSIQPGTNYLNLGCGHNIQDSLGGGV